MEHTKPIYICDKINAEIQENTLDSIKDLADVINRHAMEIKYYKQGKEDAFFVFTDNSYMLITFTGTPEVKFELGTIEIVAEAELIRKPHQPLH